MRESAVEFCPVPYEQQPINEYEELKNSWFFSWATLERGSYGRKLAGIGFLGWLLTAPIAAASFSPNRSLLLFCLCSTAGAGLLVIFILLRLYLGWSYIGDRLNSDKIIYEESGWYDGQTWTKPTTMLNRDRLIVSYQIKPILTRLQKTFLWLLGLATIGSLIWLFIG
jgi:hypothetical protein